MKDEIIEAFDISKISNNYSGDIEITDLKEELGTKGHLFVIRGDLAYADKLEKYSYLANPKFWLYENIIKSKRIQEQLKKYPSHKLFDGVGFSSLEAVGYHAKQLGRKAVVVMAKEMIPDKEVFEKWDIEVIHGDKPMEEGYVIKQAEVFSKRNDLIPLHQALYGAQALAPIGNKIAKDLEEKLIIPEETYWCMASGSNIYGIGAKIKEKFPKCKIILVEPSENLNIGGINLNDPNIVKAFAKYKLRNYSLDDWNKIYSGIAPLHVLHPNKYLLLYWLSTGKTGLDRVVDIPKNKVKKLQDILRNINEEYDWTSTTALTLVPAMESAKKGKNVLVMAYGKNRKNKLKDLLIVNDPSSFFDKIKENPIKIALAGGVLAAGLIIGTGLTYLANKYLDHNAPMYMIN